LELIAVKFIITHHWLIQRTVIEYVDSTGGGGTPFGRVNAGADR